MTRLLPILLVAALSGCASPLDLRPSDGESATVEFREAGTAMAGAGFVAVHVDDYDCYGYLPSAGTGTGEMPATKAIPVAGRRFLTIEPSYHGSSGGTRKSCMSEYTFPVHAGGRYRVVIGNDETDCHVSVEEAGVGSLPLVGRPTTVPLVDSKGPWCAADARFLGSSGLRQARGGHR